MTDLSAKFNESLEEKLFGYVLADVMVSFAAFVFMLFVVVSMVPHSENNNDGVMLGSLCAEIYWPNDRDIDLDIWGKSPKDGKPIGFSNMHGGGLDLYRDVIGFQNNLEHLNMEIECTNKIIPGEYTFNIYYFSNHETQASSPAFGKFPNGTVEATMIIRLKGASVSDGRFKTMRGVHTFTKENQEKTMFNFRVGEDGKIIDSSINSNDKWMAHQ